MKQRKRWQALARVGDPPDIADPILFPRSAEWSCVTSVTLAADGGRTFH
jgi:NAD(P)-dependent dehydrogenase (short-subunit alcohol dehydrogenase family)